MGILGSAILLFFTLSHMCWTQILIIELGDDLNHRSLVEGIACKENRSGCEMFFSDNIFLNTSMDSIQRATQRNFVVNMSFTVQKPDYKPDFIGNNRIDNHSLQKNFQEQVDNIASLFEDFSNKLFVSAAGNGYRLGFMSTDGTAIGKNRQIYPALFENSNLITVTALDKSRTDIGQIGSYRIEDYANFSLFYVDLATHVELGPDSNIIKGTSFAAPYITRVADEMKRLFPWITPEEVKEIFLKSAHIPNLEDALNITENWLNEGTSSEAYKIHTVHKRADRDKLIESFGNVILTRSGGAFVKEIALACAEFYEEAKGNLSLSESCLHAHQRFDLRANKKDFRDKLNSLWEKRNL